MTATANPTSQAVTEWCNIFRALGTENYTSSVTFMKQLTVVAVSTITYLKDAFPEDNYTVSSLGGLKLKILKKTCRDEVAQFLSTSMIQAFEAFEKKFLHKLVLCFYEEDCVQENLLEYYEFEYKYTADGVTMNINSKSRNNEKKNVKCTFEDVKKETTMLLRTLVVLLQNCQGMPAASDISVRLYYNDDAPEGYQAPGYQACTGVDHLESTKAQSVRIGQVDTNHHKLVARAFLREMMEISGDVIASQNPPEMPQTQQFDTSFMESQGTENNFHCPCNNYDEGDPNNLIITCVHCKSRQHAACFGIRRCDVVSGSVPGHCCVRCGDAGRPGLDPNMVSLTHTKRRCMSIFRRTLKLCCDNPTIGGAMIALKFNMSAASAAKLMQLLNKYGIIKCDDNDLMSLKDVIVSQLQETMTIYFRNLEETLADRLITETFESQESLPEDPITQVLSPMEKIAIQNASTLGRVISNAEKNNTNTDDQMLLQYREAILSTETTDLEELPLSGSNNPMKDKIYVDFDKKTSVKRKLEPAKENVGKEKTLRSSLKRAKLTNKQGK